MGIIPHLDWPMLTDSQLWAMLLACVMMLADIAAGFIGACIQHQVDSSKMRQGLLHKILVLIIIAIAYILSVGMEHVSGMDIVVPSTEIVCGYVIVMELASVLENIGKAWPDFTASKLFKTMRSIGGGEDGED